MKKFNKGVVLFAVKINSENKERNINSKITL